MSDQNKEMQAQLDKLIQEKPNMQAYMQSMNASAFPKGTEHPTSSGISSVPKRITVKAIPEQFPINTPPNEQAADTQADAESADSSEDSSDEDEKYTKAEWLEWFKANSQDYPKAPNDHSDQDEKSSEEHEHQKRKFRELFPPEGRVRNRDIPKAHEADSISFDNWPSHRKEKTLRIDTFRIIATSSVDPDNCFKWLHAIKKAVSMEDLPRTPLIFKQSEPKILKAGMKCCKEPFKSEIKILCEKRRNTKIIPVCCLVLKSSGECYKK